MNSRLINFLLLPELSSILIGAPCCLLVREDGVQPYHTSIFVPVTNALVTKVVTIQTLAILSCPLTAEGVVLGLEAIPFYL